MTAREAIDEDPDDAAFRARFAPLSAEVLPAAPRPSAAAPTSIAQGPATRGMTSQGMTSRGMTSRGMAAQRLPPRETIARGPIRGGHGMVAMVCASGLAILASAVLIYVTWSRAPAIVIRPPPVASPVPLAAAPPPHPEGEREMIDLLLRRGQAALAVNDIVAARAMFERAAGMGSAAGATAAGKAYDIGFLLDSGARGIQADQAAAMAWYRKAVLLGDPEARERLSRLVARPRP